MNEKPIEPTKITIELPTQAYFMSGIRDFTLELIKNTTSFGNKWAYRLQSIVDELCNNAIEYGSKKGDPIKIIFFYDPIKEFIEISVEDMGTGKNQTKAADMMELIKERTSPGYETTGIRGRGLALIVKSWTDELKFQDKEGGGMKVTIKKYLKNDPELQNKLGFSETDPTKITI